MSIICSITVFLLPVLWIVLLSACSHHDYLDIRNPDGTVIEYPGCLIINAPDITPDEAALLIDTEHDNRLIATVSPGVPVNVEAGRYTVLYAKLPPIGRSNSSKAVSEFSLDGTLVTLPLLSDDGRLPQLLEIIGGATQVDVIYNQTVEATLKLTPLTRNVQLDVLLQGADLNNIRSVEARLYGVNRTARLDNGYTAQTRSATDQIYYVSCLMSRTIGDSSTTYPTISDVFYLLGVDTSVRQRLLITANLTDGSTLSYEQDVTELFSGFNPPAVATPLHLAATLNFGIDEVTGTIVPWKPGWDEGGTGL